MTLIYGKPPRRGRGGASWGGCSAGLSGGWRRGGGARGGHVLDFRAVAESADGSSGYPGGRGSPVSQSLAGSRCGRQALVRSRRWIFQHGVGPSVVHPERPPPSRRVQ